MAHLSAHCKRYQCRACVDDPDCVHSCHPAQEETLFGSPTIETSRAARDAAMDQVDAAAKQAWKEEARRYLWKRILTRQPFTTDDLWDDGLPKPREPRALGPIIVAAVRKGYLVDTGQMRQSRYRHATKITVWVGNPEVQR